MGVVYTKEFRQAAFERFMNGESFQDIAAKMNVNARTLSRWAKDEDWEEEKRQRDTAPMRIEKALMFALSKEVDFLSSMDEEIRIKSIDRVHKITSIRKKIETNSVDKIPVAVDVMQNFVDFCKKEIPKRVSPQYRTEVSRTLTELVSEWYQRLLSDPKEAIDV